MPNGPILSLPDVPWMRPESVLDSPLTKALRMITDVLGPSPEEQITGLVGTVDIPGASGVLTKALGALGERAKKTIRAFHGSPHDFDRFSLDKIGTGEGAQAYGHGLYFAENEGVARGYRDQLSSGWKIDGKQYDGFTTHNAAAVENYAANALDRMQADFPGDPVGMKQAAVSWLREGGTPFEAKAADFLERSKAIEPADGRMYEVAINADPEDFLDWDKPLSQQSEKVQQSVRKMFEARGFPADERGPLMLQRETPPTGEQVHTALDASVGAPNVSEHLRKAGVPGIKYLDAGSRAAGDGSRNYVVFDDKLIDILKKYGLLPGAVAGVNEVGNRLQQPQGQQ